MGWIDFYNFDKFERIAIFIEIASQKGYSEKELVGESDINSIKHASILLRDLKPGN